MQSINDSFYLSLDVEQHTYQVLLTPEEEGGYSVSIPALPGCYTEGETIEEAIEMVKEAISLHIDSSIE
jgi:antitoxin HicB